MNCDQMMESGAYVLGILEADDRAAYERHLATCAICQREVADFSGLPNLLARLDPDDLAAIEDGDRPEFEVRDTNVRAFEPRGRSFERGARDYDDFDEVAPPAPLRPLPSAPRADLGAGSRPRDSRVSRGAQRRQGRWRTATAALAAAACLAVGVLVGARFLSSGQVPGPNQQQSTLTAMRKVSTSVPISAQVALNPFIGGTEVRMHCVYDGGIQAPRWTIKLFVYPKDGGAPEQVSTWTAAKGDDLTLSAATRFQPSQIAKVELRKGDDTSLLVYENA
jgi:anti-sigma-K factor RskA